MKPSPVVLRDAARRDIEEAISYYVGEGAVDAALQFLEQLEHALGHIALHPGAGSPRYAQELNLPGLRYWLVGDFPYLVFYVEGPNHVDVWRVLHGERDVPASLR